MQSMGDIRMAAFRPAFEPNILSSSIANFPLDTFSSVQRPQAESRKAANGLRHVVEARELYAVCTRQISL